MRLGHHSPGLHPGPVHMARRRLLPCMEAAGSMSDKPACSGTSFTVVAPKCDDPTEWEPAMCQWSLVSQNHV
jgi:hypothetical protein